MDLDALPPTTQWTFRPADVSAFHFVWSHDTHIELGEDCSYLLLRLRSALYDEIPKILQEILANAGINSYCIYLTYGTYDCLVQFWANESRKRDLLNQIESRENKTNFLEARIFQVDRIEYTNPVDSHTKLAAIVSGSISIIQSIESADALGELGSAEGLRQHLLDFIEAGIIIPIEGSTSGYIKYYVYLEPFDGMLASVDQGRFERRLRSAGILDMLVSPTLYVGKGFAQYLMGAAPLEGRIKLPSVVSR